jgi:hypothetical protein
MQVNADRRAITVASLTGPVALIGLLLSVATGAVALGRKDESINQKVDKATYERDIGQIKGDLRAIRVAICVKTPAACQQ